MKIGVIGASGREGKLIVEECINRFVEVSAIIRNPEKKFNGIKNIVKNIFDLTYEDVKDFDVIIDAFGVWRESELEQHVSAMQHLINILQGQPNRLLVVGGAGSLYVDQTKTTKLMDTPDFPKSAYPLSSKMGEAFDLLKQQQDINWLYVSPSADFDYKGEKTGTYQIGNDVLLTNKEGKSYISYKDYAIAMVDEALEQKHNKERITVCSI